MGLVCAQASRVREAQRDRDGSTMTHDSLAAGTRGRWAAANHRAEVGGAGRRAAAGREEVFGLPARAYGEPAKASMYKNGIFNAHLWKVTANRMEDGLE